MPIAITVRARKTRVRLPSLCSTSPIHARSPSSDIAPIYPLVENRAGGAGQIPCGPHFPPPEPRRARMPEAVIVDTIRTPIGRAFKGSLAGLRPDEMGAYVVDQLLERNPEVDPAEVEDLFCGCGMPQGLQAFNIGRIVALLSEKLPQEVNGLTISRYCSSSLDAIRHAGNAIKAGEGDIYIAAGIEWVSRYNERTEPAGADDQNPNLRGNDGQPNAYIEMGLTAVNVANRYEVSRADMDKYAQRSQELAVRSQEDGFFDREIVPVKLPDGAEVAKDDGPRASSTLEKLSELPEAFGGGAVVERAGVAGSDAAAAESLGQFGALLQGRGGARAVVLGDFGAVGQLHRDDFAVEEAVLLGPDRQFLRALGVLVHVGATDLVAVGDVDRRQAHLDVGVGLAVVALQVRVLVVGAGRLGALVVAAHPLDPGGDVDVPLAGLDRVAGVADRVEAGGAVAGDGEAVDLLRQLLGEQGDDAADVEGLQALQHAAAAEEVFDRGRIDLGVALEQPVDDEGAHLVGAQLGQRAREGAADRRADGVDDDCLGHAGVSLG